MTRRPLYTGVLAALLVAGGVRGARAQDLAAAEALFQEGRVLMDQGNVAAACGKLAESERLDPSSGTLINLADCHAKLGKTASAWAEFLAAERLAQRQDKPDRAAEAHHRAEEAVPSLTYLTVVVKSPVDGLQIHRDDVVLEASSLGSRLPTDPGAHMIRVTAPGYAPVELQVNLGSAGDSQTVLVPALQKLAAAPSKDVGGSPAPPPPVDVASGGHRALGFVVAGVGAAVLAVGATFGALSLSAYGDAEDRCPSHANCDQETKSRYDTANSRANVANVCVPVGIIGVGIGTVLVLTSKSSAVPPRAARSNGSRLVPVVGAHGAGLSFTTAF